MDGEPARKVSLSRFNLANDRYYDTQYTGKLVRVRQTFGQLVVQHSLPALKLQPPFVSTCSSSIIILPLPIFILSPFPSTNQNSPKQNCARFIDLNYSFHCIPKSPFPASRLARSERRTRRRKLQRICEHLKISPLKIIPISHYWSTR